MSVRFPFHTLVPCLLLLAFAAPGCQSGAQLRYYEGERAHEQDFRYGEGLAIETDTERRVFIRFHDVGNQSVARGDQTLMLYLSLPVRAHKVVDWSDPRVFLVWSSVEMEFSGFMEAERLKTTPMMGSEDGVSGQFVGTLYPIPTGPPRDVEVDMKRAPVTLVAPDEAPELEGMVNTIDQHINGVDNGGVDREDRQPETEQPATRSEPEGDADRREHDRPER